MDLREEYFRLRRHSAGLRAHDQHFEGTSWFPENDAMCRARKGWRLCIYQNQGEPEARVIAPDGTSTIYR